MVSCNIGGDKIQALDAARNHDQINRMNKAARETGNVSETSGFFMNKG